MKTSTLALGVTIVVFISSASAAYFYFAHTKEVIPSAPVVATKKNNTSNQTLLPKFSDYQTNIFSGSLQPINVASYAHGLEFKETIDSIASAAPNFAGRYSLAIWGCGTACQTGVIIDRSTGKIVSELPFSIEAGFKAQGDSSLIIINPYTSDLAERQEAFPLTTYYLNWNGKTFDQVGAFIITENSVTVSTSTLF